MGILKKTLAGFSTIGLAGAGYVAWEVNRWRVYPDQSFRDAARHYWAVRALTCMGGVMRGKLEEATKNVEKAQTDYLMKQIKENKDTEYSKDMGLANVTTRDDFLKIHPLTRYPHYSRYVARMLSGESQVLTARDPVVFAVTSGTSGNSNIIPMVRKQTAMFFLEGISVLYKCMVEAFPDLRQLNKDFKIFYKPNWRYSVNNIPIGPNSASPDRSKNLLHIYTTPPAAYEVRSEPEALYLYLLFALLDPHVGMMEANFSSIIYNSLCTMEEKLPQLIKDIETGQIDPELKIAQSVRAQLSGLLQPNPQRAREIRQAAEGGKKGLASRIWPELHVVVGADTGTFDLYAEKLRNGYCKGVPLYSPIYAASEGLLGINIWPEQLPTRYLLHPRTQFFEFIPVDNMDEDQPQTQLLHQVKQGVYELVITNPSCLYRYRFGDVIKVVGFHNQCPIIEFLYRKGQFLNVRGEKISEAMFYDVLKGTLGQIGADVQLADYCCTESVVLSDMDVPKAMKSSQPCYHVFVELENVDSNTKKTVTTKLKQMLDDSLKEQSYPYSSFRAKGSIDPIQVHIVQKGSFSSLRQFMLEQPTAASNQYKVPRVLRKQEAVKFMLEQVLP